MNPHPQNTQSECCHCQPGKYVNTAHPEKFITHVACACSCHPLNQAQLGVASEEEGSRIEREFYSNFPTMEQVVNEKGVTGWNFTPYFLEKFRSFLTTAIESERERHKNNHFCCKFQTVNTKDFCDSSINNLKDPNF